MLIKNNINNQSLNHNNYQATLFIIGHALWFSIGAVFIKYLSLDLNIFIITFFRNLFALPLISVIYYKSKDEKRMTTKSFKSHFLRSFIIFSSMLFWFYTLKSITIPQAVSLSFITPIITTIMAIIFLGEKPGIHRFTALIISFVGMLIIIKPDFESLNLGHLSVLIATFLWAMGNIVTKKMSIKESPKTIVFYLNIFSVLFSIPFIIFFWQPISMKNIILLIILANVMNISHFALTKAISLAEVSFLAPFDFVRLIFAAIISYLVFREGVNLESIIGSILIIASATYIFRREVKIKKYQT